MKFRMLAVAAAMALSASAHATGWSWSDNFDANAGALNAVPAGWSISNGGTVDIIPEGGQFNFLPGNGEFIDLDGSTGKAGDLSQTIAGPSAGWYNLTFQLAGNMRGGGTETVDVTFGGVTHTYFPTDTSNTWITVSGYTADGNLTMTFYDHSADNVGALLDNVTVTAVPEAGNAAMLLAGLAALGIAARRRRA